MGTTLLEPDLLLLSVVLVAGALATIGSAALERHAVLTWALPLRRGRLVAAIGFAVGVWGIHLLTAPALTGAAWIFLPGLAVVGAFAVLIAAMAAASQVVSAETLSEGRRRWLGAFAMGLGVVGMHLAGPTVRIEAPAAAAASAVVAMALATALFGAALKISVRRVGDLAAVIGGGTLHTAGVVLPLLVLVAAPGTRLPATAPGPAAGAVATVTLVPLVLSMMLLVQTGGWLVAYGTAGRLVSARRGLSRLSAALATLSRDTMDWVGVVDERGELLAGERTWRSPRAPEHSRFQDLRERMLASPAAADFRRLFAAALAAPGDTVRGEIDWSPAPGVVETSEVTLANHLDDPRVGGVVLAMRSRTEVRIQQDVLEQQRAMYVQMFEHAPLPMILAEEQSGRFLDVNPALATVYGYPRAAMIGMTAADLVAPEDHPLIELFSDSLSDARDQRVEMAATHVRADGSRFPIRAVGTRLREGERWLRLTMIEDVSGPVQERELRRGEIDLLRRLIQGAPLESFVGDVLHWLETSFAELRTAVVLGGRDEPARVWTGGKDGIWRGALAEWLERRIAEGWSESAEEAPRGGWLVELESARRDAAPFLGRAFPVRDRDEHVVGALFRLGEEPGTRPSASSAAGQTFEVASRLLGLAVDRDVRERMLQHAQRMEVLGRITGGIAHDFNNLLTVTLGNAELLAGSRALPEGERALASGIVDSARRASGITRRLLSLSRRQPLQAEVVEVVGLLGDVEAWLPRVLGEQVRLRMEYPAEPLHVRVDRAQFESALLNLAINARDAMEAGGTLRIVGARERVPSERQFSSGPLGPGEYLRLDVIDAGSGMDAATLRRVLEPFFTTKSGAGGTGFGLPMVSSFVTEAGGALSIDSRVGRGTRVRLMLPISEPEEPQQAETPEVLVEGGGRRVLIVEDEQMVAQFAAHALADVGFETVIRFSGEKARSWLEAGHPCDVVFSDVGLPGALDGVGLAEWVVRSRPEIAVVLTSGYARERQQAAERFPLLPKPYDAGALQRATRDALEHNEPGGDVT